MFGHNNIVCVILLFFINPNICKTQVNCNDYLNNNKIRVYKLLNHATKIDTFWITHKEYLSIILPEYIAESELDVANEIQVFKLLNAVGYNFVNEISIGPFQMQPKFIHSVLCRAALKNPLLSVDYINNNIDMYSSLNFQLTILKVFILDNTQYMKNDNSNVRIIKLAALYNGIIKNYGDDIFPKSNFAKLDCLKLSYPYVSVFLMNFYKL
jgi:hypothetical protein